VAQTKDQIIANLALISRLHQDIIRGCTTEEEIEYICALDGNYQALALKQAWLGILVKLNSNPKDQERLKKEIKLLGEELANKEVIAYNNHQGWADKYGNFTMVKVANKKLQVRFDNGDVHSGDMDGITKLITGECDLCGDTGWIVSYGPGAAGKYPCSCEKGTDKAKKTDYMGPVTTIDDYKKQKAVLASFQQQYNDYTKSQEIQFTSSSLQVGQTAPAPAPPEPLPPAVGRKFR